MVIITVAIIGAGASGLVTAKEAKQCGLIPTVFEHSGHIGGQWKSSEEVVWENMRINNSRHACSFSDYPWQEKSEDFPKTNQIYNYLDSYAKAFDIYPAIQFHSTVTSVEKRGAKWRVEWINAAQETKSSLFDSVIICSGIFSLAFTPEIPGRQNFAGLSIHSKEYRNAHPFENKTVAVVGNAFSGSEIAAEVAQRAGKVFHLYNRPKWVMSRYIEDKKTERILPFDIALYSRAKLLSIPTAAYNEEMNNRFHALCKEQQQMAQDFVMPPSSAKEPVSVAITDCYLPLVKKNKIIPKKAEITGIQGNTLYLSDGSCIDVDSLIFCTGYRAAMPFFSPAMQQQLGFCAEDPVQPLALYKATFHPEFSNLAFIGMSRFGIFFGIIELQARFACMALSGKITLPTKQYMEGIIQEEQALRKKNLRGQFARSYVRFCDDLAKEIGVLPNFAQLKRQDPALYHKLWNGPFTTAGFRLFGFGSDSASALKRIDELVAHVGDPFLAPEFVYQESKH